MERKITPKKCIYLGRTPDDDFCYGAFSDTDALVDSENVEDRIRMAKLGYGVDVLKNDRNPRVRLEVAKGKYYVQQFIHDLDPLVRSTALKFVAEWQREDELGRYPSAQSSQGNLLDPETEKAMLAKMDRQHLAYLGSRLDANMFEGESPDLDRFVGSNEVEDRVRMAREGYGVNMLKDDSNPRVRLEVAKGGYYILQFLNDIDPSVRATAIQFVTAWLSTYE